MSGTLAQQDPANVVEISPTKASFQAIGVLKAIDSKYNIVPRDIGVGGFVQWTTTTSNCTPGNVRYAWGVNFKNPRTIYASYGVAEGTEYLVGGGNNSSIWALGLKDFPTTPAYVGVNGTILTVTLEMLWKISCRHGLATLNQTSTFRLESATGFLHFYAGIIATPAAVTCDFSAQICVYNLWNPSEYTYRLSQDSENVLEVKDPDDGQIFTCSANSFEVLSHLPLTGVGVRIRLFLGSLARSHARFIIPRQGYNSLLIIWMNLICMLAQSPTAERLFQRFHQAVRMT